MTLALLGVLAMLAAPMTEAAVQRSREQALREACARSAARSTATASPSSRGIVRRPANRATRPTSRCWSPACPTRRTRKGGQIYFLRRLPRDPFVRDANVPAAATWGLRSYASAPTTRATATTCSTSSRAPTAWVWTAFPTATGEPCDATQLHAPARGFTMIELVIVMAMLGLLLSLALPQYMATLERGREQVLQSNLATMREAIDKFYGDRGRYPDKLEDLVTQRYLRAIPSTRSPNRRPGSWSRRARSTRAV